MFEQIREVPRFAKWLINLNKEMISIFRKKGSIHGFKVEYDVPLDD